MVILHIITSSGNRTGTEQYAFGLSKGMRERGHRMVFAINNDFAGHKDGDTAYRRFVSLGKVYLLRLKSLSGLRAIREFMSAGKAVVAADHGGPAEYLENGVTGLLVPPADPERLRQALAKSLDDPLLRKTIGKNARIKFERELSFDQFIERIYRVYYECLPS